MNPLRWTLAIASWLVGYQPATAQVERFDGTARRLGLPPLEGDRTHPWEVRIWTTGYLDAGSGISSLIRFWGHGDAIEGEHLTFWRRGIGRGVDSIWRSQGIRRVWRTSVIESHRCTSVHHRPPVEVCRRPIRSDSTWRAVHAIFEANGGWNLVDQSEAPPLGALSLDGNGWVVELMRNGGYRRYGYQNPSHGMAGPWAQAARLEAGIFCLLDQRRIGGCPP